MRAHWPASGFPAQLKATGADATCKPTGKVVGIIKRNWRPFCGMLNVSHIKEVSLELDVESLRLVSVIPASCCFCFSQSTRHLFTPADRRIPRIRIETRQASALAGQRIMVAIDGWPKHSRYPNVSRKSLFIRLTFCHFCNFFCHFNLYIPWQGHFVRSLGGAGEKDTEQEVLLLEHDVPHQAFSQAVLSFLPKMPWTITPEVSRMFQESLCWVFSVDVVNFPLKKKKKKRCDVWAHQHANALLTTAGHWNAT